MTNKFSQLAKKVLLGIMLSITLLSIGGNLGLAADSNPCDPNKIPKAGEPANPDPTCSRTFSVGTYLTIKDDKAAGTQNQSYLKSTNPVASFILQLINFIALTVASVAFVAVVYAGFLMMSSAGNDTQLNKGKDILSHAVVGLILTLSAYFIVAFVQSILFETVAK